MLYTVEEKIILPQTEEGIRYKEEMIEYYLKHNMHFQIKESTTSIIFILKFTREIKK